MKEIKVAGTLHQAKTISIIAGLNPLTYSSTSTLSLHSLKTVAIRLAVACSCLYGPASSSFCFVVSDSDLYRLIDAQESFFLPSLQIQSNLIMQLIVPLLVR